MSKKSIKKKTAQAKAKQWPLIVIAAVALIILVVVMISRIAAQNALTGPSAEIATIEALPAEISPAQASQMQAEGALLVDVREQSEWDAGHIDGAVLIPLGELANRLGELPKDKQIITVCRSGRRSAEGRDILLNNGFTQVTSMAGGMNAWSSANLPITTGN